MNIWALCEKYFQQCFMKFHGKVKFLINFHTLFRFFFYFRVLILRITPDNNMQKFD